MYRVEKTNKQKSSFQQLTGYFCTLKKINEMDENTKTS